MSKKKNQEVKDATFPKLPPASWWKVLGEPGVDERAGQVGQYLSECVDGRASIVLKFADEQAIVERARVVSANPAEIPQSPAPVQAVALPVELIELGSIDYVVDNHRTSMDQRKLDELVSNIRLHGVKQPIKVCRRGERHIMVFGHRRAKASEMAGLSCIPAMIAEGMTDQQIAEEQCIENIHREDIGPIGEAMAIKTLMNGARTIELAASMLDKPVSWARGRLNLLRLAKPVQELLNLGRLPLGHAQEIAKVGDKEEQLSLAHGVIGHYHGPLDEAMKDDYVEPLKALRQSITYLLCKMGSARWPKDARYADQRPCNGCPDNTNTEPALFDGITLTSTKGNCTNPECYRDKAAAWEKDPAKLEREKQQAAKAKAEGKQPGKGPKRGESYEVHEKRVAELKKKFPWQADQRFALATWEYGRRVSSAILSHLGKTTPEHLDTVLLVLACTSTNFYGHGVKPLPELKDALKGAGLSGKAGATLLKNCNRVKLQDYERPGISYNGLVENVPIRKEVLEAIATLEQLAAAWKVTLPARPKAEDFADKPITPATLKGRVVANLAQFVDLPVSMKGKKGFVIAWATQHEVPVFNFETTIINVRMDGPASIDQASLFDTREAAIEAYASRFSRKKGIAAAARKELEASDMSARYLIGKAPAGKPVKGTCRVCGCTEEHACKNGCSWVDGPKKTLCSACCLSGLFDEVVNGDRTKSLESIRNVKLYVLQAAQDYGLKGDWRRAAVAKRIKELQRGTK